MKNRKKQLVKIGAVIAVIAVAGITGGVIKYRYDNRFDLTVAGDPISKEEYVNCMNSVEYDHLQVQNTWNRFSISPLENNQWYQNIAAVIVGTPKTD